MLRVNQNIVAQNANAYSRSDQVAEAQSKALERLSSGLRYNKAGEDGADLALKEKKLSQIKGLGQQDGISQSRLALNATNNDDDRITISNEAIASERSKLKQMFSGLERAMPKPIENIDMAKEMMEYTKGNILNHPSTAMLAQANQSPQAVLQLLR